MCSPFKGVIFFVKKNIKNENLKVWLATLLIPKK